MKISFGLAKLMNNGLHSGLVLKINITIIRL